MKKILVTGDTGFIGKYVVKALLDAGFAPVGISKKAGHSREYMRISADITDMDSIFSNINFEIDGVIHLAADVNVPGDVKTLYDNVIGTYNIYRCALKCCAGFFINMSSIPLIGIPVNLPVNESHEVLPNTIYHLSKFIGERLIDGLGGNIITTNLRIASPIGNGMNEKTFFARIMHKCINGEDIEIYGNGGRIQNYIDVRDVAKAVVLSVEKLRKGLFLLAGTSISNMELAKECIRTTDSVSKIVSGIHDDTEENMRWIIEGDRAENVLGFTNSYSLSETIKWIYESWR